MHREISETLTSLGPGIAYSRLLRLRTGPEADVPQPSLLLECDLCEGWEMLDPLTYRFRLRKDVRWHNVAPVNGRELVAEDVVFSYERLRTPGPDWPNAPLLQNMRTVEAEDSYTLKITLDPGFPDADFLVALADGHSKVVAREAVELQGHLMEGPVIGSGPWIWRSTEDDIGSVFERNPDYFEEGLPFADELAIRVIKEEQSLLAAFITRTVDVYRASPESWDNLNQTAVEFESFLSRQGGSGLILAMNVSAPPFDNLQVRRAVLKALDPWDYVRTVWSDQGFVSLGMPVQRADWLLTRDEIRESYFADPSSASDLLASSGLGMPVRFDLTVADFGDIYLEQGRRIEADLMSAGFAPDLKVFNPSQYTDKVWRDKDYQLSVGVLPPTSTTNSFLFAILHGLGSWNVAGHSDGLLNGMIDRQAVERDPARRRGLVRDIQRYLLDQAYLFSPVTGGARWVFAPRIKGLYPNTASSEYFYWAKAWVE